MTLHSMQWRRQDGPGMETFEMTEDAGGATLRGTAAGAVDGKPFAVHYAVDCDADWITRRVEVRLDVAGAAEGHKVLEVTQGGGVWCIDGAPAPQLDGCLDLGLAFTPSTYTLAIRRLALDQGELGSSRAAWVLFPSLEIRPLDQQYRRLAPDRFRYRCGDAARGFRGAFRTELTVGAGGLMLEYPGLWKAVRDAPSAA